MEGNRAIQGEVPGVLECPGCQGHVGWTCCWVSSRGPKEPHSEISWGMRKDGPQVGQRLLGGGNPDEEDPGSSLGSAIP